ncbi:MAG: hypothetical protein V3W06_09370, partial [Acidimicrobiia bacterium]
SGCRRLRGAGAGVGVVRDAAVVEKAVRARGGAKAKISESEARTREVAGKARTAAGTRGLVRIDPSRTAPRPAGRSHEEAVTGSKAVEIDLAHNRPREQRNAPWMRQ